MYAVIRAGGKQYRVAPGDVIRVEKTDSDNGSVQFSDVLAVSGKEGEIARPQSQARVVGQVVEEGRADKTCLYFKDETYTYGDAVRAANRAGSALRELGAEMEDRVLLVLPDCPEFVWTWFGASRIGAVITMVNPLLPVEGVAAPDRDVRALDLDDVVTGSRLAAQAQGRHRAGVDHEQVLEPPRIGNVLVP